MGWTGLEVHEGSAAEVRFGPEPLRSRMEVPFISSSSCNGSPLCEPSLQRWRLRACGLESAPSSLGRAAFVAPCGKALNPNYSSETFLRIIGKKILFKYKRNSSAAVNANGPGRKRFVFKF